MYVRRTRKILKTDSESFIMFTTDCNVHIAITQSLDALIVNSNQKL